MFRHWFCVLILLAVSVCVFAQNPRPRPQKPFWCRFWSWCNGPRNPPGNGNGNNGNGGSGNGSNDNQCCPVGGIWGSWKAKTECTDTCGYFGTQTVERTCLTQANCGPCSGPSTKTVKCNPTPCKYPRNSCNTGMKATAKGSEILCVDPNEVVETVRKASCCPAGGLMETTDWSSCNTNTAQCGSCSVQTRSKICASKPYGCDCTEQEQQETQPCKTAPCTYPQQSCCNKYKATAVNKQILCV